MFPARKFMAKKLQIDAYSEQTFDNLVKNWSKLSKYRESGSTYLFHKAVLYRRYEVLIKRPDLLNKYFDGKIPIHIDIETGHYEDPEQLEEAFQKYEKQRERKHLSIGFQG
ncbi:hypothetical protein ACFL1A_00705 [Patescibacteria group bacterium]